MQMKAASVLSCTYSLQQKIDKRMVYCPHLFIQLSTSSVFCVLVGFFSDYNLCKWEVEQAGVV